MPGGLRLRPCCEGVRVLELIKAMGLTAPRNFSTFTTLRSQYVSGLTLTGTAAAELSSSSAELDSAISLKRFLAADAVVPPSVDSADARRQPSAAPM